MKTDGFEELLMRQTLRPAPPGWRDDILRAARPPVAATAGRAAGRTFAGWLREWLWPSPVAWGALAACWVAIMALDRAAAPGAQELARARQDLRVAVAASALHGPATIQAVLAEWEPHPAARPPRRRAPGVGRVEIEWNSLPV